MNHEAIYIADSLTVYSSKTLGNKYKCWYCGTEGKTEKDHFYPRSRGGVLCVRACPSCNKEKADLTPIQYVAYLNTLIDKCKGSKTGCSHGSFIRSGCDKDCKEYEKLMRMKIATITLWNRLNQKSLWLNINNSYID